MRVVSTVPAATEILCALGVAPVGVSHECDYPPAVRELPTVVDTRIDPDATSRQVDQQVARAERGAGIYRLDRDRLASLEPDLVVTQGTCDVCAVAADEVQAAAHTTAPDARVVRTHPHTFGDVLADIRHIGAVTGRDDRADALVGSLLDRVQRVARATGALPRADRPRVAVLDWLDPVMVAGHWVPELVALAGGGYDLVDPGDPARPRAWADIRAYDPEILVAAPCGFGLERATAEVPSLADRPGWSDLSAVGRDRVHAIDGNQYLNRPGPRLVDSLERLAAVVHPDRAPAVPTAGVAAIDVAAG